MPPYEPCPHCGELVLDWHNEWYNSIERKAIYSGQAAMDCPRCRRAVLWFESRDITAPPANLQPPVYKRSVRLAAQWAPVREPVYINLAGYLANHPAGQQYQAYWPANEVHQADQRATKP
jgi:hypothetical protein